MRLPHHNSSSSSSSSRTHGARVRVALRSACRSNPGIRCTNTYKYVPCTRYIIWFLLPLLKVGIIFSRRKIYNMNMACPTRASRSRCHNYYRCTTSAAELLQQQNRRSSSSRTHEARVSVAVPSTYVGLTLESFVHRTRCCCVWFLIPLSCLSYLV